VFSPSVSYTIYVVIGDKSTDFEVGEKWVSHYLGADDRIVLTGIAGSTEGGVTESGRGVVDFVRGSTGVRRVLSTPSGDSCTGSGVMRWVTDIGGNAFTIDYGGNIVNSILTAGGEAGVVELFKDCWARKPNEGLSLNDVYMVGIPAGIMSSQGLV